MAKRIKNIVAQVQFYLGKAQSGYNEPSIIVRELNTESLNVFSDLMDEFAKTRKVSEFLQPLLKTTVPTSVPSSGLLEKPSSFEHTAGIYLEDGTEVEILETDKFIPRLKHPNKAPSTSYPICRMYGANIQFSPKDPGQKAIVTYLVSPTEAVYSYTTSGDDYVYDNTTSVDWEWSKQLSDRIVLRTLANFGINLKDGQLIEYSQLEKSQE